MGDSHLSRAQMERTPGEAILQCDFVRSRWARQTVIERIATADLAKLLL